MSETMSMNQPKALARTKGFTLIEIMIVIAIIGILAAVALPAYQQYTKKARFSEVILATSSIKTAVEVWGQKYGDMPTATEVSTDGANSGAFVNTVAWANTSATAGQITATGTADVDNETYVLTGTLNTNFDSVTWEEGGTCIAAGLC